MRWSRAMAWVIGSLEPHKCDAHMAWVDLPDDPGNDYELSGGAFPPLARWACLCARLGSTPLGVWGVELVLCVASMLNVIDAESC